MSFTMEIYNLLIRYTKDSEGKDITLAELQIIPWWRCVWGWWKAKAYYHIDGYYERLEDVPEGLGCYTIMSETNTRYWTERGKLESQVITKDDCKAFYGN